MNEINKKSVARRIKRIRTSLGLNMEEFGRKLNTSKGAVNNWEKGKNLPNTSRLVKIAELGNISIDELLYGSLKEALLSLMIYADYYPGIYNLSWDEFRSENKDKLDYGFMKSMFDYISWRRAITTTIKPPQNLLIKAEDELTDIEKEKIDAYWQKDEKEKNAKILKYAIEYATIANIKLNDKLGLMSVLSIVTENLGRDYELDDIGFVKKAVDEIQNSYAEIEAFIYSYDRETLKDRNANLKRNRTSLISVDIEKKVLPPIDSLLDYLTNLLHDMTGDDEV